MVCLLCDFKVLLTGFNQSYNCQTSRYLGTNRLPKPFLILPSLVFLAMQLRKKMLKIMEGLLNKGVAVGDASDLHDFNPQPLHKAFYLPLNCKIFLSICSCKQTVVIKGLFCQQAYNSTAKQSFIPNSWPYRGSSLEVGHQEQQPVHNVLKQFL